MRRALLSEICGFEKDIVRFNKNREKPYLAQIAIPLIFSTGFEDLGRQ
jgi:hypothetical protein